MLEFDEVSNWTITKHDIIKEYAHVYTTILNKKGFSKYYIDAFAGAGMHIKRSDGSFVKGSPLHALDIVPPFDRYLFIDLKSDKVDHLQDIIGIRDDVVIKQGNCNDILKEIFPKINYNSGHRALCVLDPYGLDIEWEVIELAGKQKAIELFIHFPVMDIHRNALWINPNRLPEDKKERMNRAGGDDTWLDVLYDTSQQTFIVDEYKTKKKTEVIVKEFRERLKNIAGFKKVPSPKPMLNSRGAVIYYLFFASPVDVAGKIITDIFKKRRY